MFRDRQEAALRLAGELMGRTFRDPLVLAIPRGGVAIGAVLARELDAELDVVLARKLRAPGLPELAIGAISEDGQVYLNRNAMEVLEYAENYLTLEQRHQRAEIARRRALVRGVRPQAPIVGRSVIVTDDGVATGSTMIAALQAVRGKMPFEIVVAVPVGAPDRLEEVKSWCDELVCLEASERLQTIGQFYDDFSQVEDEQMLKLLRQSLTAPRRVPHEVA
jgi:predicted phosphoribosyltransferase